MEGRDEDYTKMGVSNEQKKTKNTETSMEWYSDRGSQSEGMEYRGSSEREEVKTANKKNKIPASSYNMRKMKK